MTIPCQQNSRSNKPTRIRSEFGQLVVLGICLLFGSALASVAGVPKSSASAIGRHSRTILDTESLEALHSTTKWPAYTGRDSSEAFLVRGGAFWNRPSKPIVDGEEEQVAESTNAEAEVVAVQSNEAAPVVETAVDITEEETPRVVATNLRLQGKEFHDGGDFIQAASLFQQAADTLLPVLLESSEDDEYTNVMIDEYATCRLHEALCHLKGEKYELCVEACTNVLQDGEEEEEASSSSNTRSILSRVSPAVRARALHRRAKAKLALEDRASALQDARSAAFLGDRKAVAFYGRLMRGSTSPSSSLMDGNASPSSLANLLSPSAASSSNGGSLLESLLNKSNDNGSNGATPLLGGISPSFMLNALQSKSGKGEAGGGLAKSVLESLGKRLEEESMQDTICQYLHGTSKTQLEQLAAMAGVSPGPNGMITEEQLEKIVNFCHGVTPKTIRTTVRTTKRTIYGVQVIRRIMKVLSKYKSLIAALILLQWSKSAILRPLPVNKRAAKQALKQAMKENRAKPPTATNK